MKKTLALLAITVALTGAALAGTGLPGPTQITNPAPGQAFAYGQDVPVSWTDSAWVDAYEFRLLHNDRAFQSASNLLDTSLTLVDLKPGYFSVFVRGTNYAGVGDWSTGVTFIVRRDMSPSGITTNKQPRVFRWTRSEPATRYLFKLAQFNQATGKYVVKHSLWIPQPTNGAPPKWIASKIPDGKYRWTITDYKKDRAGYTQTAQFRILGSGFHSWNDPKLIPGTWKVLDVWRWSELTFYGDGVLRTTQANGVSFTRARWSADENTLTLVSDVTERCPYTITANSLIFTTPKGNTHRLSR